MYIHYVYSRGGLNISAKRSFGSPLTQICSLSGILAPRICPSGRSGRDAFHIVTMDLSDAPAVPTVAGWKRTSSHAFAGMATLQFLQVLQ